MGIIRTGFDACDNCCTVCCLGAGAACLVVVGLPLSVGMSIIAAPYTLPMYYIRARKYTQMLRESFLKLPIVYREILMKEFNFQTIQDITFQRYVKYLRKLKKQAHADKTQRKYTTNTLTIAENKFLHAPQELLKSIVFRCIVHPFEDIHEMNVHYVEHLASYQ